MKNLICCGFGNNTIGTCLGDKTTKDVLSPLPLNI